MLTYIRAYTPPALPLTFDAYYTTIVEAACRYLRMFVYSYVHAYVLNVLWKKEKNIWLYIGVYILVCILENYEV